MRRQMGLLAMMMGLSAVLGCVKQQYSTRADVESEPLVVDQAMQQRQWEPTVAYYENGATRSASTGFAYQPAGDASYPVTYAATDTGVFLLNVITLPYTYFTQWDGIESGGVRLPPSYTANPPVPPSTQPTP